MMIQCPECQTRYRLEAKQFAGQPKLRLRCTKCAAIFEATAASTNKPAPVVSSSDRLQDATVLSRKGGQLPDDKSIALSVLQGPQKGKVFAITKPNVVLGRAGSDIVVDDTEISRKHCALEIHGTTSTLVDLDSTNGTFVDDKKIQSQQLEHMSVFRIGSTTLMFTVTVH